MVSKYFGKCQPILPAVYEDSLSYYESICKLIAKINELVDAVNNIKLDILDEANAYTDEEIRKMESRVNDAVNSVIALKQEIENEFDDFKNITQETLNEFSEKIDLLYDHVNDIVYSINARTDLVIKQNNDFIFREIENNILKNITVLNYFTGENVSVQEMFNYLSMFHLDNAMTYAMLYTKNITVDYLVGKHITYTDLVKNGNTIL